LEVDDAKADKYLTELLQYSDQYFRVPGIILGGAKFAFEQDGVERVPNGVQFVKWSCRIAAKNGSLDDEFAELLKGLASEFAGEGESEVAAMINELAATSIIQISKQELIEKLIQVAPHIIKKDILEEHLAFLTEEMIKPRPRGMWEL
jgi:hypothetical protein